LRCKTIIHIKEAIERRREKLLKTKESGRAINR
jgi:hypothetical protein